MNAEIALAIAVEAGLGDECPNMLRFGTPPLDALIDSSRPATRSE